MNNNNTQNINNTVINKNNPKNLGQTFNGLKADDPRNGVIRFRNLPVPSDFSDWTEDAQHQWLVNYVNEAPLQKVLATILSGKRKIYILKRADPSNINKSDEELWKEAGYKTLGVGLRNTKACPYTAILLYRLKRLFLKSRLGVGEEPILEEEDLLQIMTKIISEMKIPLKDGRQVFVKDQQVWLKIFQNLLNYYDMNTRKVDVTHNVEVKMKLPEPPSDLLDVEPLKEVIDVTPTDPDQ